MHDMMQRNDVVGWLDIISEVPMQEMQFTFNLIVAIPKISAFLFQFRIPYHRSS